MPPSLKETNPAPPYNTPTASASGAARHQPANMTRPARHVPWAFFFCALAGAPYFDKSTFFFPHTKTYPVQHLRPRYPACRSRAVNRARTPGGTGASANCRAPNACRQRRQRAGANAERERGPRFGRLPCPAYHPPGSSVRRERDTWTGRALVLRLCLEQARSCSRPAGVLNGLP